MKYPGRVRQVLNGLVAAISPSKFHSFLILITAVERVSQLSPRYMFPNFLDPRFYLILILYYIPLVGRRDSWLDKWEKAFQISNICYVVSSFSVSWETTLRKP